MSNLVQGKVAEFLSPHSVAINVGAEAGVAIGNRVTVWRTVVVKDPDSQERLGEVRIEHLQMVVKELYDKMSVVATLEATYSPFDQILGVKRRQKIAIGTGAPEAVALKIGQEVSVRVTSTTNEGPLDSEVPAAGPTVD